MEEGSSVGHEDTASKQSLEHPQPRPTPSCHLKCVQHKGIVGDVKDRYDLGWG